MIGNLRNMANDTNTFSWINELTRFWFMIQIYLHELGQWKQNWNIINKNTCGTYLISQFRNLTKFKNLDKYKYQIWLIRCQRHQNTDFIFTLRYRILSLLNPLLDKMNKVKKKKIAWIQCHHLYLQWKFKSWAAKVYSKLSRP